MVERKNKLSEERENTGREEVIKRMGGGEEER